MNILFYVKIREDSPNRESRGFSDTVNYPVLFISDDPNEEAYLIPNDKGELHWMSRNDIRYQDHSGI